MKAIDFINQNLNPLKILEYYHFRHIEESEDTIRSCCEIHKGDNPSAFVWNKSNNLWYCYTGDCHGGDVFTLIEKMENVSFPEAVQIAAAILGLDIADMKIEKRSDLITSNTIKWLEYMKSKNKKSMLLLSRVKYQLPFANYYDADDRFDRFDSTTLQYYQAQFAKVFPTEDGLLYNKLVIPVYQNKELYGVALRDVTGIYQPKWMYQPPSIPIRELLYNYDNAMSLTPSELILVEGIFDVWAYHNIGIDNVVAVFGSSLKKEQLSLLLKSPIDTVITSFDNDKAGQKCTEDVTKSLKNKLSVKKISLPDSFDPADCKPEELLQAYLNRQ